MNPATPTVRSSPGRRAMFSAEDAVNSAITIGLDTFTVSAVARDLGVTAAAVYRRFPSHDSLLNACIRHLLAEIRPLTGKPGWQDTLRSAADEWWSLCSLYPAFPVVIARYPDPVSRFFAGAFSSHLARLQEFGLSSAQCAFAASLIISASALFREDADEWSHTLDRDELRHRAVNIILAGLPEGWTEWEDVSGASSPGGDADTTWDV